MKSSALLLGAVALLAFTSTSNAATTTNQQKNQKKKPNIVFIFTDDQDYRLDSLSYMANVQKYLVKEGTIHKHHYATIAVCCPSRVGLLRGQYAHNTNITDVSPPHGGYDRFNTLGLGEDYLPIWLQKAGYNTNYVGKLMNQYAVNNYNNPIPKGFNYQEQLVDPYTYVYNTAVFSINGQAPVWYNNSYQTDVIHAKAKSALKRVQNKEDPFFLWVAPMAPHGQFALGSDGSVSTGPAVPAARHAHLFQDVKIPRTPHFNPDKQLKTASYWKTLEKLNATLVEEFDEAYRNRLRALQAVDEMIGTIFEELTKSGELENTYVVYSADNGYHLGQHRAYPGKCTNLEEDINVPLIVRGPGVPKGKLSHVVSAHHDLASTFLALAQGDEYVPNWVDGGVIPVTMALEHHHKLVSKESFNVEFWGLDLMAENYPIFIDGPNTYKTLRVISEDYNYMYAVWCTGEHEFYDLKNDPYELTNLYHGASLQLLNRLDALLLVLKSCRAETCRNPWRILHPNDTSVKTLADALHHEYDAHYAQFRKVHYEECLAYYNSAIEQPAVGQHFLNNVTTFSSTTTTTKIHYEKSDQSVIHSINKRKTNQNDKMIILPMEYHDLFKLVHNPEQTGHVMLDEDIEKHAVPVPKQLLESNVNWAKWNFYGFGN